MSNFSFTSNNQPSALAFFNVQPKSGGNDSLYRIIAYIPQYNPKALSLPSGFFPYKEKFSGPGPKPMTFRGELRDINFGLSPWNNIPGEPSYNQLPKPFHLRWVIPENSNKKATGTIVGLAEVSDASTTNKVPGHNSLNVYRMNNIKVYPPVSAAATSQIDYVNLVYIVTAGPKPDLTTLPALG